MNDLTPVPPHDAGLQLMEPMPGPHAPSASRFRIQKFLFALRKFWWIPALTVMLGGAAAVTLFLLSPPVFVSVGSLWQTEKLNLPDGASFSDDRNYFLGTQSDILHSKMLRDMTLNWMRASGSNQIVLNKNGDPLPVDIQVFASPKSMVYTIEARSSNPAFTPAYLDALMRQYLEYRHNTRRSVSGDTLASISEQVQRLEREMKAGQQALTDYERSNNFAVLQEEASIQSSYLSKLKTELSDYQLQMKLLDARELEVESGGILGTNSGDTLFDSLRGSSPAATSVATRYDAAKQIELLKLERARLSKYLKPKHPKIVKLDEDIAKSEKLIQVYRQQNQEQLNAARKALQIKIDGLQQFVKQWETKLSDSNARIAMADTLKQNVQRNQGLYDRLTSLLQNVDISRNIDQDTLAILESASPATRSYKEARSMLIQAVVLGLGLGLGVVFLIALRDDRFNSLVEVTEKFGDSVVGQVPDMSGLAGNEEPVLLLNDNDDRHMFAESYRNLRSALLYLSVDGKRPRVLLISSAVPNEGKSTVATNLARAMAMGGSKVLLMDADLRKGHIHERLKLNSKPGLSELLRSSPEILDEYIQTTDLPNFEFLARGAALRNPGDLFLSPCFDEVLRRLRQKYDYVLIDSSPVFAADDSSTLAPKVDGTLFVVRSRFSQARVVREALEILFQRQARVLGLILNRSDASARSYYAYKYAEYYSSSSMADTEKS
jgi:capsular exopolysaccharide synthesis family protein